MTVFGIENAEDLIAAINDNKILFEDNVPDDLKGHDCVVNCDKFYEHNDKKIPIVNSMYNLIRIGEDKFNYIDKFLYIASKDKSRKNSFKNLYFKYLNNWVQKVIESYCIDKSNVEIILENGTIKKIDNAIAYKRRISDFQMQISIPILSSIENSNYFVDIENSINDILTSMEYSSIDEFEYYYEKFLKLKENENIRNFLKTNNYRLATVVYSENVRIVLNEIEKNIGLFSRDYNLDNTKYTDFDSDINMILNDIDNIRMDLIYKNGNNNGSICHKKNIDMFEEYYNNPDNNSDYSTLEYSFNKHKNDNWTTYMSTYMIGHNYEDYKDISLEELIKNIELDPGYINEFKEKYRGIAVSGVCYIFIEDLVIDYFIRNVKYKKTNIEFLKNIKNSIFNEIKNEIKIEEYYNYLKESEERLKQYIAAEKIDKLNPNFRIFNNIDEFKYFILYEYNITSSKITKFIYDYLATSIINYLDDINNIVENIEYIKNKNFDELIEKIHSDTYLQKNNRIIIQKLDKIRGSSLSNFIYENKIDINKYCFSYVKKIMMLESLNKIEYKNSTLEVTDPSLNGVDIRGYLSNDQIIKLCLLNRGDNPLVLQRDNHHIDGNTQMPRVHSYKESLSKASEAAKNFINYRELRRNSVVSITKYYKGNKESLNEFLNNLEKILKKQVQDEENFLRKRSNSMGIIDSLKNNNIKVREEPIIADGRPTEKIINKGIFDYGSLNQFKPFTDQFKNNYSYICTYFQFLPEEAVKFFSSTNINDIKYNIIEILNFINSNNMYKYLHDNVCSRTLGFLNETFKEKDFGTKKEKIERFTQIAQLLHNFESTEYEIILLRSKYLEKSYLKNIFDLHTVIGNAFNMSIDNGVNIIEKMEEIRSENEKAIPQKYLTEDMLYCITSLDNIINSNDVDLIIEKILSNNPSESVKKFKYILGNILNYEAIKQWIAIAQPKAEEVFSPSFSTGTFRFRVLGDLDPYHFSVGVDTGSCQAIGGPGESAAVDSFINPNAGVVVLEVKDGNSWNLAAQSYFHFAEIKEGDIIKKAVILDNIEAGSLQDKYDKKSFYPNAYAVLGNYLKQKGFDIVGCGSKHTKVLGPNEGHNLFNTIEIEKDPRHFEIEKHNLERYTDVIRNYTNDAIIILDLLRPKFEIEMPKNITKTEPYIEKESFKLLSVYLRKFGNNKGLNLQSLSSILNSFGFKKESVNVNRLIYKTI